MVTYGVPAFLILRKFGKANLSTSIIAALFPTGVFWLYSGLHDATLFFGFVAIPSALTFWVITRETIANK